jgi:hypothetical protein
VTSWLRDRADARALERAVRVFERREWKDAPGRNPVVADAVAHLGYRAKTLRPAPKVLRRAAKRAAP